MEKRNPRPNYIIEYFNAIPAKWYGMIPTLSVLIATCVAGGFWLFSHGLQWYWIVSGVIAVIIYIILSFLAYRKVAIERDDLKQRHEPMSQGDITVMEWRKNARQSHMPKVSEIPNVLMDMWSFAKTHLSDRQKQTRPKDIKRKVANLFINLLDVKEGDPLLKIDMSTERNSTKAMKLVGRRMGMSLKIPSLVKGRYWQKRTAKEMDDLGWGLMLNQNENFVVLKKQLEQDRTPISQTGIDKAVDIFCENLNSFYNLELLRYYCKDPKGSYVVPKIIRDVMREMSDAIEKTMRGSFTRVKYALETYSIGGSVE